jgi:hypothetical protein
MWRRRDMNREIRALGLVALAGGGLLALTTFDVIAERSGTVLLAGLIAAVLATFVHRHAAHAFEARGGEVMAMILAAMVAGEVILPVATSLVPGEPLVVGELEEGDHLIIPEEMHGSLRLVVHAEMPDADETAVDYRLEGLSEPLAGHLERLPERAAGVTNRSPHRHDTEVQLVEVAGASDLVLRRLRGADVGPLEVRVFRQRWPLRGELGLAVTVLLACVVLSLRRRRSASTLVPAAVAATVFGVMVLRWLTPQAPLGQELSALFVATIVGAATYAPWHRAAERPASG